MSDFQLEQIFAELDERGLRYVRMYEANRGDYHVIAEDSHGQYHFRVWFFPDDEVRLIHYPWGYRR